MTALTGSLRPRRRPDALVVASMRSWVADEFQPPAARAGVPLVHSFGLDVPDLTGFATPAWWTPTEHAARLVRAGVPMPLLAPGPWWLANVPADLTGRRVWAGQLADIAAAPASGFCKPAEIKVEHLPARWWDSTEDFAIAAAACGLSPGSWMQVADTRLDLAAEYRCFVVDGLVTASSIYMRGDITWYEGMAEDDPGAGRDALRFAAHVCAELAGHLPPSVVVDVARTRAGQWLVLEANPTWSSATYGCDMDGVLAAVLAAVDYDDAHDRWAWTPDDYLVRRAARQRLLPRR